MSRYSEDLDYLWKDIDISKEELEEIIDEADKIISNKNSESDKLVEAYLKKVQCLQKLEKDAESKPFIDTLLSLRPNMPEALVRLGVVYYYESKYDKVFEYTSKAIACNEKYAYAYFVRVFSYNNDENYEEALKDCKNAVENKTDFAEAYNMRGWKYFGMGKYDNAIEDFKYATNIKPKYNLAFNNWKNSLDEIAKLQKDENQFEDYDIKSAYNDYYTSFFYAAYERLHSAFDSKKSPDFDKAVVYFLSNISKEDIKLVEYYLLMSSMEYLYYEAPEDEQNLFMVLELIDAGKKERGCESDLDRLFNMLKEKDAEHIAVKHYEKFKVIAGDRVNDIIKSCRKHFSAIGNGLNIFKYVRENDKEYNISASAKIEIFAKIIMRTFAKNKPNPHENLYNYLVKLYEEKENEDENEKQVKYTNISIGIDEVIELKKFYDGCGIDEDDVDDEDDSEEELKIENLADTVKESKSNLFLEEKKSEEKPEFTIKQDLETMNPKSSTRGFLNYDKAIEESKKIIDDAINELYNIESDELEKNKTKRYLAHINLGEAFLVKAVKESNAKDKKEYYESSFKQYGKAKELAINDEKNICSKSLGVAYMYRGGEGDLENAAKCFTKAKVDISILPKLKNNKSIDIAKIMLDDNVFFTETTKNCSEKEKDKYKDIYIKSLEIMSALQIQSQTEIEMPAAYYTTKVVSEKLLFDNEPFHLNSIKTSNDPEEGKTLFRYLFPKKEIPLQVEEFIAFAGCFTFNNDCLNQFRLYGKTNNEEGTGVSIAFNKKFFNENICTCVDTKVEDDNNENNPEPLPLFRCIYIDPDENNVVSLGQKEEYVFFREGKGSEYETYKKEIEKNLKNVNAKLNEIQAIANSLSNEDMVYKLLLNLRYLIKHVAFKEEQECRIIQVKKIARNKKIKTDSNNRLYIKYLNLCKDSVEKICFGPRVKDKDKEIFKQFLVFKENGFEIEEHIRNSTSPLA